MGIGALLLWPLSGSFLGALGLRPSTVMKQIEQEVGFEILPRTRIQEILDAERPSRRPKKHRNR